MISKCQNVVINRTKFSDFENFDTKIQSTEKLNLVGYVTSTDDLGNDVTKNVSIKYPEELGPRLDNIEKVIGMEAFENVNPDCHNCDCDDNCSIACKLNKIESNINLGWDRDEEIKDMINGEVDRLENEIDGIKNFMHISQENIIFVRTSLENGTVELSVSDILAKFDNRFNSGTWSLVIVTAVKMEDRMIHPEILYSGSIETGNYDKRKIKITQAGAGNKDITVVINVVKSGSKSIISM